jgi:endonuclease YncB( thermonuclease family)
LKLKILLVASLFLLVSGLIAYSQTFFVERVIDGDTIKLSDGERVRLIGIDTPENRINNKTKKDSERSGQDLEAIVSMGKEASKFTKGLVAGKEVRLEFDVHTSSCPTCATGVNYRF